MNETHLESLPGCLQLKILAVYNLVPMWSHVFFESLLNCLKSTR